MATITAGDFRNGMTFEYVRLSNSSMLNQVKVLLLSEQNIKES